MNCPPAGPGPVRCRDSSTRLTLGHGGVGSVTALGAVGTGRGCQADGVKHPVAAWTAACAALFIGGLACLRPPLPHSGVAWLGWVLVVLVVLAVQPVYPWIAHRWGTPALRPPAAWAPTVFLARLLSSLQLTLAPFLLTVALFGGSLACVAGLLAALAAGCVGTYQLREQRWSGLLWKAVSLLPVCLVTAYGPNWAVLICMLPLDLAVLTSLATWTARRAGRSAAAVQPSPVP